ncbi:MAG TPA: hypothetical protein VK674_02685 [Candidatus Limnocylindria bacterium]|nr:hypothetical protein [Candidatus Limnocylindria bacterium]
MRLYQARALPGEGGSLEVSGHQLLQPGRLRDQLTEVRWDEQEHTDYHIRKAHFEGGIATLLVEDHGAKAGLLLEPSGLREDTIRSMGPLVVRTVGTAEGGQEPDISLAPLSGTLELVEGLEVTIGNEYLPTDQVSPGPINTAGWELDPERLFRVIVVGRDPRMPNVQT